MHAKRWLWIAFAMVVSWSGIANAQVTIPDPIDVGSVLVGGTNTVMGSLGGTNSGVNVDLVLTTTCTGTGTGTFTLSSSTGALTNIDPTAGATISVTYEPDSRGLRECTVNIFNTGTSTPATPASFKVRGTGIGPVMSTNPATTLALGSVRFNDASTPSSASSSVTLTNNGDATLTFGSITITGTDASSFSVTSMPGSIDPAASDAIGIAFNPTSAGAKTATLNISTNESATVKTISLTGTGTTGVINVAAPSYGTVTINSPSTQNIAITNTGAAPKGTLAVTQATFMNNGAGWFKWGTITGCTGGTAPCALSLAITNGTSNVPVTCDPPTTATAGQTVMASVVFASDTDAGGTATAMLTCTAGRADLGVVQTPLAFGDQLINSTSTAQTIQISNTGNQTLTYSLTKLGTDAAMFTATAPGPCTTNCTLGAGLSTNVTVTFRPTSVGAKTATLRVTAANDPDTTNLDVALSGNGVSPVSSPSATTLAYGNVDVGDTATGQMLTVTNNGTYPLTISAAFLQSGAADYTVTAGTTGNPLGTAITVQPSQSTSWTIACKPTAMNARNGTFRITSNHNGTVGTTQDVALTCNGQQGSLVFLTPPANPYDFGGVREGDTVQQTFTLRNNGNVAVNNITVAFTGTGTGYTFNPTTIASIGAASQVTVTVTFAPVDGTYGGLRTATYSGSWGTAKTASAALTVNGDGLTTGYDTLPSAPNALDFGNVRFDQQKTMDVSVINTAGSALKIQGLTITPGTAQSGEFTVLGCRKGANAIACPTMAAPYNSSGINDTIVVQVRVDPNNRVAMLDATLTIASDLAMNPNRSVPLKANSNSAAVGLNPTSMVLDFGPVDLDATPVSMTRTITMTNTGAAQLDFTSVTKTGARYTFTAATPAGLAPAGAFDVNVTYTPTTEKPANQPDTGTIVLGGLNGVFGGTGTVTIQLTGYGVDRHIAVGAAPAFPDTYKNPGTNAPVRPVTITNTGDASLNLSAVMLTNDPIWTLVNPDPVVVQGRGTHDFNVRFAPIATGKAPTGRLTIMNNDNGRPLVTVDLDGNGVGRNVSVGPGTIDLGYVGIGMTVRLSAIAPTEVLGVANGDDTETFPLSKVEVVGGDGVFEAQTLDGAPLGDLNLDLAPRTTYQFDIAFTPNAEGDFTADAVVYIGDDPQQAVQLRGHGLFVETGGGGGCSTGRGNGLAMVLVVLALGFARRRRGLLAMVMTLVGLDTARADQTRNVSLSLFDPTPATDVGTTFQLQGADVADEGSFGVMALLTYANQPLLLRTSQNDDAAVENRTTAELGLAYAFKAFEIGIRMPMHVQNGAAVPDDTQRLTMFGVAPGGTARGDLTLHTKYQLGARGGVSYGFGAALTVPTATKDEFAGNEQPTGRALFLLSLVHGPLGATLNAGGVARAEAQLGSATQKSGGVWGAGLSLRVLDKLWLTGELFGEVIPGGQSGQPMPGQAMGPAQLGTPMEGLFGMRVQMARTTSVGLAVGRGVTSDMGSPALRGVFTLSVTPSAEPLRPLHPPRPPEPEKDADGDGISDKLDQCPNEPEDLDMYNDSDGCPELDNDGDGVPDTADKCPLDAEDKDNFEEDDGCPDRDNDFDGINDGADKCPLAPEDRDGFEDTDGCPEPDNDKDGLVDAADKCPNEPETINGNADDDGCPDKGNALVVQSPDRLETLESIQFSGTKITKSSLNVLGQVGATLRAHPEVLRVRVTAHVNPTSNAAADKSLSEQRAKAVREWLIEWGIDPLRVQAAGFGGTKPLVPASTKGAQDINDRIELIILERR